MNLSLFSDFSSSASSAFTSGSDSWFRVRSFLWLVGHGKLLTNAQRKLRHLCDSEECSRCHLQAETLLHALRDCVFSRRLWHEVLPPSLRSQFFMDQQESWLVSNLTSQRVGENNIPWCLLFGIVESLARVKVCME